ncbi:MAG: response regulator transcription factor [Granulosicoccus sp.]
MSIAGTPTFENDLLPSSENSCQVLLISNCLTDAEYVSNLLNRSGHRCAWVPFVQLLSQDSVACEQLLSQSTATVLCHRKSENYNFGPLDQLLRGQRIIVLSDCEAEHTVVTLLNSGAHYFFNLRENESLLQARLEASLRFNEASTNKSFVVGDIDFDASKRKITRWGKAIDLSPKEYELAYYLFSNRDRVVCNSELMTLIWSLPATNDTRRIDTAVSQLRKKLLLNTENGWQLKRLRNIGYRLIPVAQKLMGDQEIGEPRLAAIA